jgi:hypothetical protein
MDYPGIELILVVHSSSVRAVLWSDTSDLEIAFKTSSNQSNATFRHRIAVHSLYVVASIQTAKFYTKLFSFSQNIKEMQGD